MDTTGQKIKYEEKKEQERKRRFGILSGSIKPIQTTFHLKAGEYLYYQCPAQRTADKEYSRFYTSGKSRTPFIQHGIFRGSSKINTETEQVRGTSNETIDSGILLFTNKRVLFVGGKQVIDILFDEIITIDFTFSSMIIKYPQMLSGENYECNTEEAELYYQGIQRLTGKDKSTAKLEDVRVSWAEFEDPDKKASGSKWYKSNAVSIILLFLFFPLGLFMMWKFTKWNIKVKWVVTGVGTFLYIIFLIGANSGSTQPQQASPHATVSKTSPSPKAPIPTKENTIVSRWQNLKKLDDQVISYNTKLANQCEYIVLAPDISAIGEWKTIDDGAYDTLFASMGEAQDDTSRISSTTSNYSLWKQMADVDNKLLNDFQDIENQCDNLSTDTQSLASRNVSGYASAVQVDKTNIDTLMSQRKSILTALGY